MLSKLSSLSIASLRKLDEEVINSMIENMTSIILLVLLDVTLNMLFDHTLTRK